MVKYEMINIELDKEGIVFFSSPDRPFKVFLFLLSVILLPAHPAVFAPNFVSGMQSFLFQRVPGCNSIADLSLKIVFWTHKFAVGLIDTP